MSNVAVLGAGAGGLAAVAELTQAGHRCALWNRGQAALQPILDNGSRFNIKGQLGEEIVEPGLVTGDISAALADADVALVVLPTLAHVAIARALAEQGWTKPVVLNPGHTGGALEVVQTFKTNGAEIPPVAEFSTLTYIARKPDPVTVNVTGVAKSVRVASLPDHQAAVAVARQLYPNADPVMDVAFSSLANMNLVLHPPGAVLGAAWVEATGGDFTFYVEGMTQGVADVMQALDDERRAVGQAFGHDLPPLLREMNKIGSVEDADKDKSILDAVSGGQANRNIKAPDSFAHRYYREDFGHGLLPFIDIARVADVDVPIAGALFALGRQLVGEDLIAQGRSAGTMGFAGMDLAQMKQLIGGNNGD